MFDTSLTSNDLLFMLQGAWVTLKLTAGAMLIGTLAGVLFGLLRAALPRATLPLAWVLDVFRSVPLLIQFVLFNALKSIAGMDMSAFTVGCTAGLCLPPSMSSAAPTSRPLWQTIDWSASAGQSRAYGSATGASALPGLAAPPRYIVERLPPLTPTSGTSASLSASLADLPQVFRITARGVGLRSSTVVVLQSTYIKR